MKLARHRLKIVVVRFVKCLHPSYKAVMRHKLWHITYSSFDYVDIRVFLQSPVNITVKYSVILTEIYILTNQYFVTALKNF